MSGAAQGAAEPTDQALLSGLALASFKLNGQFLEVAEALARPAGLTATWWQVLGAVIDTPRSVAGVAREMGITRQSVQRTADLLVDRHLAEYRDNPAHRRAKLVVLTDAGRAAMHAINPQHRAFAARLVAGAGRDELAAALEAVTMLSATLDRLAAETAP